MNILRSMFFIGLLIYLPACGFQLRGGFVLPPELESIQLLMENLDARQGSLLRRQLQQAGASLQPADGAEQLRLTVSFSELASRLLADAAGSGKSIVRLSRELSYSLDRSNGDSLIEAKTLRRQLDLVLDNNNILDSDERIRSAGESLDRDLIDQLIFSLKRF